MIGNNADNFKPEIVHPESREYQTLVADLKKREQYLEPGERLARHPEHPHIFATSAGRVINAWRKESK